MRNVNFIVIFVFFNGLSNSTVFFMKVKQISLIKLKSFLVMIIFLVLKNRSLGTFKLHQGISETLELL